MQAPETHEDQVGFAFTPSSHDMMDGDEIPGALTVRRSVMLPV